MVANAPVSMPSHQWQVVELGEVNSQRVAAVHVVPVDDLRQHVAGTRCWCAPQEDPEVEGPDNAPLWIHNSLDRREQFEALPLQ